MNKIILHWCDLPERTVIKIDPRFQEYLIKSAFSKVELKKELSEILSLNRHQLRLYLTLKSNFSIKSLKKLVIFTKIPVIEVEKHITGIGRKRTKIKNPKLPFKLTTKEGISLRSIVNSEGHIPKVIGTSMHIRVPEMEILENAIKYAKTIFGNFEVEIKKTKNKNTHEIFFPSVIVDSLILAGLKRGRKSIKNPSISQDVMKAKKELQKYYLQWSFACEAECIGKNLEINRYVDVTDILPEFFIRKLNSGATYKKGIPENIQNILIGRPPNLLLGECQLLKNFGILTKPRLAVLWKAKNKRVSAGWALSITNKKSLEIVNKEIGIPLKEKANKLEMILSSYKR